MTGTTSLRFRAAATKLKRGAKIGATVVGVTVASLLPANAQQQQAQILVAPPVMVTPDLIEPRAPGSLFTEKECRGIARLLLAEMKQWTPTKGDPQSELTNVLPASAIDFTGIRNDKFTCVGTINWSTRGERAILDAVAVGLSVLETDGTVSKGIAKRFAEVYPRKPTPASKSSASASPKQ